MLIEPHAVLFSGSNTTTELIGAPLKVTSSGARPGRLAPGRLAALKDLAQTLMSLPHVP